MCEGNSDMESAVMEMIESGGITKEEFIEKMGLISKAMELDATFWLSTPILSGGARGLDATKEMLSVNIKLLSYLYFNAIALKTSAEPALDKHKHTLSSKRERMIYIDEYGDENSEKWDKELKKYYTEKLEEDLIYFIHKNKEEILSETPLSPLDYDYTRATTGFEEQVLGLINIYISINSTHFQEGKGSSASSLSGIEYELYLCDRINRETSWMAELTKASGDQGADIILSKNGITVAVQTKLYSSSIGNKAVQEAHSAKKFYNTDLAFVVTNSRYTDSAWKLSEKTGVRILSEQDFMNFLS